MAEEINEQDKKVKKIHHTQKETWLFLGKMTFKNDVILTDEQPWWLALIILLVSLVISVSGILINGYRSNANSIVSTSTESAVDKGFARFAESIDETTNTLKITYNETTKKYELAGTGTFLPISISASDTTQHEANATYQHANDGTAIDVFKVWIVSGIDPANVSSDNDVLTTFIHTSIFKYDSTSTATWTPCSFMILTPTSLHISTYKATNRTATDSAVASASGRLDGVGTFDFYTLGHATDGTVLPESDVSTNMLTFINKAYDSVKIYNAWYSTGIYAAASLGIMLLAGVVMWLVSRTKTSLLHFTWLQGTKIASFMSFTPSILTFAFSFWMASYATFAFLFMLVLRIMTAVQKLSGSSQQQDNKPVYKARS